MYLKNVNDEVKEIIERVNGLSKKNKLKFISYVFDLWNRNQINSLNETNPDLLDDSIEIEIFNPRSVDYTHLVNRIKEYWNYTYKLYRLYRIRDNELISLFDRLSFKDKKNILIELFLILEHNELLPDYIDGYEIARIILKN